MLSSVHFNTEISTYGLKATTVNTLYLQAYFHPFLEKFSDLQPTAVYIAVA